MARYVSEVSVEVDNGPLGFLIGFEIEGRQLFAVLARIADEFRMQSDFVGIDVKNAIGVIKKTLRTARGEQAASR